MVAFLARLFRRPAGPSAEQPAPGPERDEPVDYKGFAIQAAPEQESGKWRVAGVIVKRGPEGEQERSFQRADTFASRDEAASFAIIKARQIIDERGDSLFADGAPSARA